MAHRTSSFSSYVSSNTIKTENLDENNEEDHKAYLQEKIEPWLTWGFYHLSKERPDKPLVWFHNFLMQHKEDSEPPCLEISVDGESRGSDAEKHTKLSSMSTRAYLDATVVSYVTCGMHELWLEKPENPILWFANYFLKHANSNEPPKLM